MALGVIKLYKLDKGFGFIESDDGSGDVFFHISKFKDPAVNPIPGMRVKFEVSQGRKGFEASQLEAF